MNAIGVSSSNMEVCLLAEKAGKREKTNNIWEGTELIYGKRFLIKQRDRMSSVIVVVAVLIVCVSASGFVVA